MDDAISRQDAITAIRKAYADTEGGTDKCAVWKNVGLTNALHIMQDLPSAQPETHEERTETHACDLISRQAVIEAINKIFPADPMRDDYTQGIACGAALAKTYIEQLPSAQPIRCKACRWRDDYEHWLGCPVLNTDDDNFCSMAERRTDET